MLRSGIEHGSSLRVAPFVRISLSRNHRASSTMPPGTSTRQDAMGIALGYREDMNAPAVQRAGLEYCYHHSHRSTGCVPSQEDHTSERVMDRVCVSTSFISYASPSSLMKRPTSREELWPDTTEILSWPPKASTSTVPECPGKFADKSYPTCEMGSEGGSILTRARRMKSFFRVSRGGGEEQDEAAVQYKKCCCHRRNLENRLRRHDERLINSHRPKNASCLSRHPLS